MLVLGGELAGRLDALAGRVERSAGAEPGTVNRSAMMRSLLSNAAQSAEAMTDDREGAVMLLGLWTARLGATKEA